MDTDIINLKGIGPKTAEILYAKNIHTLQDLLETLPRDYEFFAKPAQIKDIKPGKITVKGKIKNIKTTYKRHHLNLTEAEIHDNTGAIRTIWFNQPYRAKQFDETKDYYFSGDFAFNKGRYQLTNPSAILASDYDNQTSKYQPIYPQNRTLKSTAFKKIINNLHDHFAKIPNILPDQPDHTRADHLYNLHFPESKESIEKAREYLAGEELFVFILGAKLNKISLSALKSQPLTLQLDPIKNLIKSLPFTPTDAQRKASFEILKDMEKSKPMNRLLQGDVGSGKTLVAAIVSESATQNGVQVAILAPTAVLATQHYQTFQKLLPSSNITLLTSATKQKTAVKEQIKNGEINIIIGTHALLTDDTTFNNLGLVIIDEQHRFGVRQRQNLLSKNSTNQMPHLLSMTATPIPRSLQLTLFGDLDISIIDELPQNRQPIHTTIKTPLEMHDIYDTMTATLKRKEQIYYICKNIEESEDDTKNVAQETKKLKELFPKYTIASLHGKLKPSEKEQIMQDFVAQKIDILVSTTVVEVGVDNPNATLIIIENADRYGLAALHQLRGRVGRDDKPSQAILITSSADQAPTRRLRELERSTDGFHLANIDLELRGPGAIYGTLQHGILDLKIASLADTKLIKRASLLVDQFLAKGPNLKDYPHLQNRIKNYQHLTTLN